MSKQIQTPVVVNEVASSEEEKSVEKQRNQEQKQNKKNKIEQQKAILGYLAEKFPKCFVLEGHARPLKIGIFQDLVERLEDDSQVSKTQLRQALRYYTSSWRYLHSLKENAVRVDLDGNDAGLLEKQHAEHAQNELNQAKERFAAKRDKHHVNKSKVKHDKKRHKNINSLASGRAKGDTGSVVVRKKVPSNVIRKKLIPCSSLTEGQKVNVKVAGKLNSAIVIDVMKEAAKVQLNSGITLNVAIEHLFMVEE